MAKTRSGSPSLGRRTSCMKERGRRHEGREAGQLKRVMGRGSMYMPGKDKVKKKRIPAKALLRVLVIATLFLTGCAAQSQFIPAPPPGTPERSVAYPEPDK